MKVYTVVQAAKIKRLDVSRIRRLCENGKIPAVKFGRGWLITASNLAAWKPNIINKPRKYRTEADKAAIKAYKADKIKNPIIPVVDKKLTEKITENFFEKNSDEAT